MNIAYQLPLFDAQVGLVRLLTMGLGEFLIMSIVLLFLFAPLFWSLLFKLGKLGEKKAFKVFRIVALCLPVCFLLLELIPFFRMLGVILFVASFFLAAVFFAVFLGIELIQRRIQRTFPTPQLFMVQAKLFLNVYLVAAAIFTTVLFVLLCIPYVTPFMIGFFGSLVYASVFMLIGVLALIWLFISYFSQKKILAKQKAEEPQPVI